MEERKLNEKQLELAGELLQEKLEEDKKLGWNLFAHLLALTLGISGFALLWVYVSWQASLGVFLVLWGDNINANNSVDSKIKKAFIRFRLKESAKK